MHTDTYIQMRWRWSEHDWRDMRKIPCTYICWYVHILFLMPIMPESCQNQKSVRLAFRFHALPKTFAAALSPCAHSAYHLFPFSCIFARERTYPAIQPPKPAIQPASQPTSSNTSVWTNNNAFRITQHTQKYEERDVHICKNIISVYLTCWVTQRHVKHSPSKHANALQTHQFVVWTEEHLSAKPPAFTYDCKRARARRARRRFAKQHNAPGTYTCAWHALLKGDS